MQTREKFCEVFTLKFVSFPLSTKLLALFVYRASSLLLSFAALPNFYCDFSICECK